MSKFIPSQNSAMTNVGYAMATIDAFIEHIGEGRHDDICADSGRRKTKRAHDGGGGPRDGYTMVEQPAKRELSPEGKLQAALLMSAIEDSFRLTPVVGTEWYNKDLYLARYENFAKRWLRGEGGYWSAAECFETVGIEYTKALAKLESAWLKHGQTGEVVVQKSRRAESGGSKQRPSVNA